MIERIKQISYLFETSARDLVQIKKDGHCCIEPVSRHGHPVYNKTLTTGAGRLALPPQLRSIITQLAN